MVIFILFILMTHEALVVFCLSPNLNNLISQEVLAFSFQGRACALVIFDSKSSSDNLTSAIQESTIQATFVIDLSSMTEESNDSIERTLRQHFTCGVAVVTLLKDYEAAKSTILTIFTRIKLKHLIVLSYSNSDTGMLSLRSKGYVVKEFSINENKDYVRSTSACPYQSTLKTNLWTPQKGYMRAFTKDCPHNLANRHVLISYVGLPPYLVYGQKVTGSDIELVNVVAEKFGFTYELKKESVWARRNPQTNKWEGTLASVMNGTSLMGIGVHMTSSYQEMVDYAALLHMYDVRYCAVKPSKVPPFFNFLKPFQSTVWLLALLTLIVGMIAYVYITSGQSSENTGQRRALLIWGTNFSQTTDIVEISHMPTLIFLTTWLGYILFLLSAYECNLRAYLMQTIYEKPVEDDYDIVNMGKKLFLPRGTFYPRFFQYSPFPIQREIWEVMDAEDNYFNMVGGLVEEEVDRKIVREGNVFIWTTDISKASFPMIEERHGWQPYRLSKKIVFLTYNGWVMAKGQPSQDAITMATQRLTDAGIKTHFVHKYIKPKYLHPVKETSQPEAFEIAHILVSLLVLLAGSFIAIAVFALEMKRSVLQMTFLESMPRLDMETETPVENLIFVKHYNPRLPVVH